MHKNILINLTFMIRFKCQKIIQHIIGIGKKPI
jgi:hypothetical protein